MAKKITDELEAIVKLSLSTGVASDHFVPGDAVQALCNVLEAVFIHGLKDPYFLKGSRYAKYPEPNFWPFVCKFSHRNVRTQITALKQIKTDIGRARAWIRIVLNETSLEHYFIAFRREPDTLRIFYRHDACIRDDEEIERMLGHLRVVAKLRINAPVNSTFLNSWTPTPLILAGLISGQPVRVRELSRARDANHERFDPGNDDHEVGMSAIDYDDLNEQLDAHERNSSFLRRPTSIFSDDEDRSSFCSHPSIIDTTPFLSSTPTDSVRVLPLLPEVDSCLLPPVDRACRFEEDVIVHRRRRRPGSTTSSEGSGNQPRNRVLPANAPGGNESEEARIPVIDMVVKEKMQDDEIQKSEEMRARFDVDNGSSSQSDAVVDASSVLHREGEDETTIAEPFVDANDSREETPASTRSSQLNILSTPPINIHRPTDSGCATSLGEELLSVLGPDMLNASGNSLVGRAWTMPYHLEHQGENSRSLLSSSSTDTDSSSAFANFDAALRSAMLASHNAKIDEHRPHSQDGSEHFVATVNGGNANADSVFEVGQASLPETADHAAIAAARTRHPPGDEADTAEGPEDPDAEIIASTTVSGLDECGVPENTIAMLTAIQHEMGLDAQAFRCPGCRRSIGLSFSPYRVCAFDARCYCVDCWRKGAVMPIPARLLHSWDTTARQVARPSRELLNNVADRPLIRVDEVNPELYEHCLPMRQIRDSREKLSMAAMYLLSCRQSIADDLRRRLWPKEYLYTDVHLYSVGDLYDVISGVLARHLNSLINFAISHIHNCALCVQKGFICELCANQQIIYPFQVELIARCPICFSVFHKPCFANKECPKCARRRLYSTSAHDPEDTSSMPHLTLD